MGPEWRRKPCATVPLASFSQSASDELVITINEVPGRNYPTPAATQDVIARMAEGSATPDTHLTPRQREVLRLITEGRRTKEIAVLLNVSTRTVETHKYEMMQALGVQTTVDLVRYAIEHRLIVS
jgi:DNA-binding NarL/FixJ family response regulator